MCHSWVFLSFIILYPSCQLYHFHGLKINFQSQLIQNIILLTIYNVGSHHSTSPIRQVRYWTRTRTRTTTNSLHGDRKINNTDNNMVQSTRWSFSCMYQHHYFQNIIWNKLHKKNALVTTWEYPKPNIYTILRMKIPWYLA